MDSSVNAEKIKTMTDVDELKKIGISLYKALKIQIGQKEDLQTELKLLKTQSSSFQEMIQKLLQEKEKSEELILTLKEQNSSLF